MAKEFNPWNEYHRQYRERNPEKVARWRYNNAKRVVEKYEAEHPELKTDDRKVNG